MKKIEFIQSPTYDRYGDKLLSEEDFVSLILEQQLTRNQLREQYGVTRKCYYKTLNAYRGLKNYNTRFKKIKSGRYSKNMMGNTRGKKFIPCVLLEQDLLKEAIKRGKPIGTMAKELGISEYIIKKNISYYDLIDPKDGDWILPRCMQSCEIYLLDRLEVFSPGIIESARNYKNDPHKFFSKLYLAFVKVQELVWFIQQFRKSHAYYVEAKIIPRDHICWGTNKYELLLSMSLLQENIPHIRQFYFYKHYAIDFCLPKHKLFIEVDGGYHEFEETKKRDTIKERAAKRLKYRIIRFSVKDILERMPFVIEEIKKCMKKK